MQKCKVNYCREREFCIGLCAGHYGYAKNYDYKITIFPKLKELTKLRDSLLADGLRENNKPTIKDRTI